MEKEEDYEKKESKLLAFLAFSLVCIVLMISGVASGSEKTLNPYSTETDIFQHIELTADVGVQNNYLYRGVPDRKETPVIWGSTEATIYDMVRTGLSLRTENVGHEHILGKWNGYGEIFGTPFDEIHELKFGLGTDEINNSSTELYLGATGPLPVPYDLYYDITASRSNQTQDIWYDLGVFKDIGQWTVGSRLTYGEYRETQASDGFEYVEAMVDYEVQYPGLERMTLSASVLHGFENGLMRGVNVDGDTWVTGGIKWSF